MLSDNQKFLQLLASLSFEETQCFSYYLEVPNHNISYQSKCKTLLEMFISHSEKREDGYGQAYLFFPEGTSIAVANKMFGADPAYSKRKLSHYLTYLCKAFEMYIGQLNNSDIEREIIDNDYLPQLLFLEFLQKRALPNLFETYFKKLEKQLRDDKNSEHLYYVQKEAEQLSINHSVMYKGNRSNIDLNNLFKLTAQYNFLGLIKLACSQANFDLGANVKGSEANKQKNIFVDFKEEAKKFSEDGLIQLYYKIYVSFNNETSINEIEKLIEDISTYKDEVAADELQKLYKFVQNICLDKTRSGGDLMYRSLLLNIYKSLDKLELLVAGNNITVRLFLNIVNESGKTNNFEWGHQFIEKYKKRLPINQSVKIANIASGLLFFENEKYHESIEILDKYDMYIENDPRLENNRNILLIKAFYETKQFGFLSPRIEKHLDYLRRARRLPSNFTRPNILFLQTLGKLIKIIEQIKLRGLKMKQIEEKTNKLIAKINSSSKRIDNKVWLLMKIEDLVSK